MNPAKAKDHFSAYYEGTLDRGLKQTFETRLREDAQLQAEYLAFENTMQELDGMRAVEVVVPSELHEKIAARLDKHVWDQKRTEKPSYFRWLRGLALAGVAGVGFFIAYTQLNQPTGKAGEMGIINVNSNPGFSFETTAGNGVTLSYDSGRDQDVTIRDESGQVLQRIRLTSAKGMENKPLSNDTSAARVLTIELDGSSARTLVALPGKAVSAEQAGKGNLRDLARAIAAHYQKPVVISDVGNDDATMTQSLDWNFATTDPVGSATEAVSPLNLKVELRSTGIIWIFSH